MGNQQPLKAAERRAAERRSALDDYLCLVDLGDNRSAMLLDVSETGIGVQTVEGPGEGFTTKFRFQLPDTAVLVEGEGEIAWADRAGRMGVRFTKIAPELLPELRTWVASEANPLFAHQPVTDEIADLDARDRVAQLEARIIVSGWAQIQALNFLVDQISAMTQASGVAIAVEDGAGIVCKASSGTAPQVGVRVNPRSGLSWECVRTKEVVTCVDTENDPRVDRLVCRQLNMRSAMLVPVMKDSRIAGLVEVFSSRPHAFNNQTVILLRRVAEAVAGLDETASGVSPIPESTVDVAPVRNPIAQQTTSSPVESTKSTATHPFTSVPGQPAARPIEAGPKPFVPAPTFTPGPKPFVPTSAPAVATSAATPFVPTSAPTSIPVPAAKVFVPAPTPAPTPRVTAPAPVAPPAESASSASAVPAAGVITRVPGPAAPVRTGVSSAAVAASSPAPATPAPMRVPPVVTTAEAIKAAQEVTTAKAPQSTFTKTAETVAVAAPTVAKIAEPSVVKETTQTRPVSQRVETPLAPVRTEKPLADKPRVATASSIAYQDAPLPEVAFIGAAAAAKRAAANEAPTRDTGAPEFEPVTIPAAEPDRRKLYVGGAVVVFLALSVAGGWYVAHLSAKPASAIAPPTVNAANPSAAATVPATIPPAVTPSAATLETTAAATPNPVPTSTSANAPATSANAPAKKPSPSQPPRDAEPDVIVRQTAATFVPDRAASTPSESAAAPSIAIAPPNTAGMASLLATPVAVPKLGRQTVSQGVTGGKQLVHVQPLYPSAARALHLSGLVTIKLHVAKNGMVSRAEVVSGHPLLNAAALEAVKRWRYQPFMLNGEAIENDVSVQVRFDMPR